MIIDNSVTVCFVILAVLFDFVIVMKIHSPRHMLVETFSTDESIIYEV